MNRLILSFLLFFSINAFSQCINPINSFPYTESFETGQGNWFTGGTNNDWAWATPVKPTINSAGAGTKCWVTGGPVASFYNLGERSWVQSPCFDFTNLNKPYVSFLVFWETERTYDGGNFQYSINGNNWITLGTVNETDTCNTHNWYNASQITNLSQITGSSQGWSGTVNNTSGSCAGGGGSGGWKRATHCMQFLAGEPMVKFRFTFGAGTTCNDFDGLAFDDIYIGESPNIPADFTYSCIGPAKYKFEDLYRNCYNTWVWNFDDPSSPDNTGLGNTVEHTFSHGGQFNVTLIVTGTCSQDTQITKPVNVLSYTSQSTDVTCGGFRDGTATVTATGATSPVYSWTHDVNLIGPQATGLGEGYYFVRITDGNCSVNVPFQIVNGPFANPHVYLGEDSTICPGTSIVLKPGEFSSYKWQDNSTDSFFVISKNGLYSVNVTNVAGCSATDSIIIEEDCMNDIVIPNAFTPNSDGINDVFYVNGSATAEFEIFIYDRWGQMIFNSPERGLGWDGTVKGNLVQEGFYSYVINYSLGKEELVKSGSILLIR